MVQNKQNSEVEAKKRYCSNVEWYRINKIVKQRQKKGYCSNVEWHRINKLVKQRPNKGIVVMLNGTE